MDKHLINILTRTSRRPNSFDICKKSIDNQSYKNINHIISVDDKSTLDYTKGLNIINVNKILEPTKEMLDVRKNEPFAPYEHYLDIMIDSIEDGWIMMLDDDDMFMHTDSLNHITDHITSEDDMLLWKVQFPKFVIPRNNFGKPPVASDLSMIGFMFHSKWKKYVEFGYWSGGDFRVASKLYNVIPNKIWIDRIETGIQKTRNHGKGEY